MTVSSVLKKSFIEKPSSFYSIHPAEKVKWGSLEAGECSTGRRVVNRAFTRFFAHRNYSGSQKSEFRRQNENAGDEI